jgi:hypothetical protein
MHFLWSFCPRTPDYFQSLARGQMVRCTHGLNIVDSITIKDHLVCDLGQVTLLRLPRHLLCNVSLLDVPMIKIVLYSI